MFNTSSQTNRPASAVLDRPGLQTPRVDFAVQPKIDKRRQKLTEKIKNFRIELGPSRKDVLHFTNQLAVMVRAGISLQDALEAIGQQIPSAKFRAIILDLRNQIEAGQSFSQALSVHSDVFGSLYINMVAAAEISGSLSDMLRKLAEYLDEEAATRSQIKSAMVYPIIIAVMAVSVTIFLLCFVLPRFITIFAGKEHLLPTPTKILMASSAFVRGNWYFIVLALMIICGGLFYLSHRHRRQCQHTRHNAGR